MQHRLYIVVNGVVCAILEHKREAHTRHAFWGDLDKVTRCLTKVDEDGFKSGRVEVARNLLRVGCMSLRALMAEKLLTSEYIGL